MIQDTRRLGLFLLSALALVACGRTDESSTDTQALIVTGHCSVSATGAMPSGESVSGSIVDAAGVPSGSWSSSSSDGALVANSDWLECRVNGSTVADFTGTGTWNGAAGYTYRVHVQDRGTPGAPVRVEGPPTTQTLTASRTYGPTHFTDGVVSWDAGAYATVPASLAVTTGNGGNGWSWLTLEPEPDATAALAYAVRCRYRSSRTGTSYDFVDCQRPCSTVPGDDDDDDRDRWVDEHGRDRTRHGGYAHGGRFYARGDDHHGCDHDHDDGDDDGWCSDPALVSGAQLLVSSATLRVQNGSSSSPSRHHAITTVSVSLAVQPFVWSIPENDFYRLAVWDPSGALVHSADGDLASGDIVVTLLP